MDASLAYRAPYSNQKDGQKNILKLCQDLNIKIKIA